MFRRCRLINPYDVTAVQYIPENKKAVTDFLKIDGKTLNGAPVDRNTYITHVAGDGGNYYGPLILSVPGYLKPITIYPWDYVLKDAAGRITVISQREYHEKYMCI